MASAQYFGMAGNGAVALVAVGNGVQKFPTLLTKDACVDVAFCEGREDALVAACTSDGWLHLVSEIPGNFGHLQTVGRWQGHKAETASVDFSMHDFRLLLSTGWDGRTVVWDVQTGAGTEIGNFGAFAYQGVFSPHDRRLAAVALGNVLGDGNAVGVGHAAAMIDAGISGRAKDAAGVRFPHGCEVLSVDFDKYRPGVLVTGAVDGLVRFWDARNATSPISVLHGGHRMAVRKVKASPWTAGEAATVSYDLSLCHWRDAYSGAYSLARKFERLHSEFIWGLDWSLHQRSLVATAGWDRHVHFLDLTSSSVA